MGWVIICEVAKKTSFDPADSAYRQSFTGFNKRLGIYWVYPNGGGGTYPTFDPLAVGPWLLNTFDQKTSTESGETQIQVTEYCFNQSNGFLEGTRRRKSSTSRDKNDIISNYADDSHGNVIAQKLFGADMQDVSVPGLRSSACFAGIGVSPQFELFHEYSNGVRSRSYYEVTTGGVLSELNSIDRDIDFNTGLPTEERDSSGYPTRFTYDQLGRVVFVNPEDGARTRIEFQPALGVWPGLTQAKVTVTAEDRAEAPAVLSQADYSFNAFGNLVKERHLLADGSWNQRLYGNNEVGWQTFVSEWQEDGISFLFAKKTSFTDFDIFGRPGTTTLPDGSQFFDTYIGNRLHIRTSSINIGENKEDTTTTWEHDALGRLRSVSEPYGENGTMFSTVYSYDIGNRLTQVNMGDGAQLRIFDYDLLGFLRYSDIPERLPGTGQSHDVSYANYDAMGNAGLVVDGDNSLRSFFDEAGRLTEIRDYSTQAPLKELKYCPNADLTDACAGWNVGKLGQTLRHNYFEPLERTGDFIVSQNYDFEGIGGAVSRVVTEAGTTGGLNAFETKYWWTDLGDIGEIQYPTHIPETKNPVFSVAYGYSNGWLTLVAESNANILSTISYQPNGLFQTITNANGVTDNQTADPNAMIRPSSLSTDGASGGDWASGTYLYDGSGNIAAIGNQDFYYDKAQRLISHRITNGSITKTWDYSYDQFGNFLSQIASVLLPPPGDSAIFYYPNPTDSSTNRLLLESYDVAGNQISLDDSSISFTNFNEIYETNSNGRIRTFDYDFGGERIIVMDNQLANGSVGKIYSFRGLGGKVLREFQEDDVSGLTWIKDYVYRGSKLLASISDEGTRHFHLDHLGTPRLITDVGGNRVAYHEYLPFGMEMSNPYEDTEKMKFTGHERDFLNQPGTNFDLDYMHARHYSPSRHRFLSLDLAGADLTRPQSWNLYTYVLNNPMKYMDPFGLEPAIPCDNDGADNGAGCGASEKDFFRKVIDFFAGNKRKDQEMLIARSEVELEVVEDLTDLDEDSYKTTVDKLDTMREDVRETEAFFLKGSTEATLLAGGSFIKIQGVHGALNRKYYHRVIKQNVLKAYGSGYKKLVGTTPNLRVDKKGFIHLVGQGPFRGKSIPTTLKGVDFF